MKPGATSARIYGGLTVHVKLAAEYGADALAIFFAAIYWATFPSPQALKHLVSLILLYLTAYYVSKIPLAGFVVFGLLGDRIAHFFLGAGASTDVLRYATATSLALAFLVNTAPTLDLLGRLMYGRRWPYIKLTELDRKMRELARKL